MSLSISFSLLSTYFVVRARGIILLFLFELNPKILSDLSLLLKLSSSRQIIFMYPLVLDVYVERVPEF